MTKIIDKNCSGCDGTGQVHNFEGQWLGTCFCVETTDQVPVFDIEAAIKRCGSYRNIPKDVQAKIHIELTAAAAQPARIARMLTAQEMLEALVCEINTGVKHTPQEVVQRKFCEVNGISLANQMIAAQTVQPAVRIRFADNFLVEWSAPIDDGTYLLIPVPANPTEKNQP